nr:hypothetical protein [Klebsiella grimontii]
MTSKLTREQLHERARENVKALKMASRQHAFESAREEILADLQLAELALAAMDSEPDCKERKLFCSTDTARMRKAISVSAGTGDAPLYLHAQPAPVVPDGLLSMAASAIEDLLEHTDPNTSYYSGVWADVPGKLRAAMLAAAPQEVRGE